MESMQELRRNEDVNWSDFNADSYRREYFTSIGPEDDWVARRTMQFMHESGIRPGEIECAGELGTGPALSLSIAVSPYVQRLYLIEPAEQNANYLSQTLHNPVLMHNDWSHIAEAYAQDPHALPEHKDSLHLLGRTARLLTLSSNQLVAESFNGMFSSFFAESATEDQDQCAEFIDHGLDALTPGGVYAAAFMERSSGYPDHTPEGAAQKVDYKKFPAANIEQPWLEERYKGTDIHVERCPFVPQMREGGYTGVLLAIGVK